MGGHPSLPTTSCQVSDNILPLGRPTDNAWVQLNVGGTVFETTRQTLCRDPESFLARLVSEDSGLPGRKDKNGAYLIDRDPDNFAFILRYLRTGLLKAPDGVAFEELMEEAEFYNLPALVKLLEDAKSKKAHIEYFIVARHLHEERVHLAMTPADNRGILDEIRRKGLCVDENSRHYYIQETADTQAASQYSHTWAFICAKLWPVLFANGFKLEKEEPNSWIFVRTVEK